jgi:prevent-host-death family protein
MALLCGQPVVAHCLTAPSPLSLSWLSQLIGQMMEIGAFEAKNTLGSLLDRVEKGEEIIITRRGKAVARLAPVRTDKDRSAAVAAAKELLELSKGATLGGLNIKDLIEEGRP